MPPVKQESPSNNSPSKPSMDSRPQGNKRENRNQDGRQSNKRPFQRGGGGLGNLGGGGLGGGPNKDNRGFDRFQMSGPTTNLQTKEGEPKKFTGRCRLFVGNLTQDIEEDEFREMFSQFGEISEIFLNRNKGFGFVKMDTRQNAENAKAALDGQQRKGRVLRVRFATHGAALRIRNLSPWVSNELLEKAFSMFGDIERAVVIVDDRGRPVGEGIVEFARRPGAQMALKRCNDGCFLLCSSPRPVIVEPLEQKDEEDGLPEKNLPKSSQYMKEREIGPRFTPPATFEYEFATRWKQLYELEKQKREALEKEIRDDRERLEEQMEFAVYEQETNILREKLRQREQDANNLLREREMRRRDIERREEMRRQQVEVMHHQGGSMGRGGEDMRRRQEDNLLMQASHLNELLNQQEAAIRQMQGNSGGGSSPNNNEGMNSNSMNNQIGSSGASGFDGSGGEISTRTGSGQLPSRQSRFDQPSQGPMGPGGPLNRMGGPMGPGGPMGNMSEMRGGMGRREMMERRDHRDEYGTDVKRRRY